MAKPPVHLIRPIIYPKLDDGHGAEHRTLEELATMNNPHHPEANQPEVKNEGENDVPST